MYKTFREGTSWFVQVSTSAGTVNKFLISTPKTPQKFPYAQEGCNWIEFDLLVAVTGGVYRYANSSQLTGCFVTNILCSSITEAKERLKLPLWNPADTKAEVEIQPTTVRMGYLPGTEDVQMFIEDTSKLLVIGSTATEATW